MSLNNQGDEARGASTNEDRFDRCATEPILSPVLCIFGLGLPFVILITRCVERLKTALVSLFNANLGQREEIPKELRAVPYDLRPSRGRVRYWPAILGMSLVWALAGLVIGWTSPFGVEENQQLTWVCERHGVQGSVLVSKDWVRSESPKCQVVDYHNYQAQCGRELRLESRRVDRFPNPANKDWELALLIAALSLFALTLTFFSFVALGTLQSIRRATREWIERIVTQMRGPSECAAYMRRTAFEELAPGVVPGFRTVGAGFLTVLAFVLVLGLSFFGFGLGTLVIMPLIVAFAVNRNIRVVQDASTAFFADLIAADGLRSVHAARTSDSRVCPQESCGSSNPPRARFCGRCGTRLA